MEAKLIILLYYYYGNKFAICHWDCSCLFERIQFLINGEIEIAVQKPFSRKTTTELRFIKYPYMGSVYAWLLNVLTIQDNKAKVSVIVSEVIMYCTCMNTKTYVSCYALCQCKALLIVTENEKVYVPKRIAETTNLLKRHKFILVPWVVPYPVCWISPVSWAVA